MSDVLTDGEWVNQRKGQQYWLPLWLIQCFRATMTLQSLRQRDFNGKRLTNPY
jgi:archaellum component FlaF (FlaF/FlaG flagellin family)